MDTTPLPFLGIIAAFIIIPAVWSWVRVMHREAVWRRTHE